MTKLVCPRLIREENPTTPPVHHRGPSPSPSPSRCQETNTYNENPKWNKFNHFFLRSEFCSEQTRAGRTPSVCSFRPPASLGQVRIIVWCLLESMGSLRRSITYHYSLQTQIIHLGYTRNNAIYMILYVVFFVSGIELSLIHIWRCRRYSLCRSRWSPYH